MSIVATILWKNVILATPKVALNNVMLIKITQASQMMSGKIVAVTAIGPIGVIFGHFCGR